MTLLFSAEQTIETISFDYLDSLLAMPLCSYIRIYDMKDSLYLLLLNLCTMPAFVIGSLRAFFRKEGTSYRTERNS
jgi:hypothetical protein